MTLVVPKNPICINEAVNIFEIGYMIIGGGNKLTHAIHYTLFTKKVNSETGVNRSEAIFVASKAVPA